jgi:hypothetical protein
MYFVLQRTVYPGGRSQITYFRSRIYKKHLIVELPIGGNKMLKKSNDHKVAVVTAGITLYEASDAAAREAVTSACRIKLRPITIRRFRRPQSGTLE